MTIASKITIMLLFLMLFLLILLVVITITEVRRGKEIKKEVKKEVKNITDFYKMYCDRCGSQRCDRSEEWMDACPYYKEWKGM